MLNMKTAKCSCNVMNPISERQQYEINLVVHQDEIFRYQLLSRMKMDCEYFLGFGNMVEKYLWAGSVQLQIAYMKAIWNSFPADKRKKCATMTGMALPHTLIHSTKIFIRRCNHVFEKGNAGAD